VDGISRAQRAGPLKLLRVPGDAFRGIGLSQVGADGPPPPSSEGASSVGQRIVASRLQASALDSHPGAQGTASNPPRGKHIDIRV
jgi:hypothetical protein